MYTMQKRTGSNDTSSGTTPSEKYCPCKPQTSIGRALNVALGSLIAFIVMLFPAPVRAQIPSPDSVLGFHIGEDRKVADWDQVVDYYQKIAAAAPDRMKFEEIGKTTEGRPFIALVISSADNIKNLDHYREIQARLADPRGLTEDDEKKLEQEGKAVVLITCTVHSTELASTQTSMQFVYNLLTQDTLEHQEILNNVIFILNPPSIPTGRTWS